MAVKKSKIHNFAGGIVDFNTCKGGNIDGTGVTLQSGDEISRDASDLSGGGKFLIVINTGSIDGEYKVEADK